MSNFLDVNNNKLNFDIFRKATFTDLVIPAPFLHTLNLKIIYFRSLLKRLITIPLSDVKYKKELNLILQIAMNYCYSRDFIYTILKYKKKFPLQMVYSEDDCVNYKKIGIKSHLLAQSRK